MTNSQRAAYHLDSAAQLTFWEIAGREIGISRNPDKIDRIRWHLFQARYARLCDVMSVYEAFYNADKWAS
jgi:hypothetical protein